MAGNKAKYNLRKGDRRKKKIFKDPKGERRNHVLSKKKERAVIRQLRHQLKAEGIPKATIDEVLPTKKQLKQAQKQQQQQLALEAPAAPSLENDMDISGGAVGEGVGITLGAPTVFRA
ncbi:hypothetical protein PTSG_00185 [Salpingoeca rosetta]|uniref:Uncharacterized protein n=1 Tax=Salpingoeca rosetta (strain ATCC 50818 / BSB-021) TaxID=946362 RepID=F2TVR8_SALR5|nr:uncharacterized protein PTSG_00185 [Salpingoeca rosetta]EGD72164.1 hypothetical protein PTSG_00185 [Salpingoeca rosetta]|eukprot:XP_004998736.1 hypothetical protein PTSG_00185 [Salpingoeca rosetta]